MPIDPSVTTRRVGGDSLELTVGPYTPPTSDQSHYLSPKRQPHSATAHTRGSTAGRATGLPAIKIGGRVKVLRADLDALASPKQPAPFESITDAVQRLVAAAPPLTPEQTRRLRDLLGEAS